MSDIGQLLDVLFLGFVFLGTAMILSLIKQLIDSFTEGTEPTHKDEKEADDD